MKSHAYIRLTPATRAPRHTAYVDGAAVLVGLLAWRAAALTTGGAAPTPRSLWTSWSWEPSIILGLVVAGWLYARGLTALWTQAGVGRGVRCWQAAAFAGGLAALVIALVSPLDALADDLVSAHMVQHLLLIVVAAPLLVLGRPLVAALWALPPPWRKAAGQWWRGSRVVRPAWRVITLPLVILALHTAALWLWHLPGPYQAAVQHPGVHALEHACFLGTALLLWWSLVHARARGRLGYGAGVLLVALTGMQSVALGVLFTFSQTPWYPVYVGRTAAWGLAPLDDQRLAGVIMWVPPSVIYLAAACLLFMAWMKALERAMQRTEGRLRPALESLPLQASLGYAAPSSRVRTERAWRRAFADVHGAKGGDDDAG